MATKQTNNIKRFRGACMHYEIICINVNKMWTAVNSFKWHFLFIYYIMWQTGISNLYFCQIRLPCWGLSCPHHINLFKLSQLVLSYHTVKSALHWMCKIMSLSIWCKTRQTDGGITHTSCCWGVEFPFIPFILSFFFWTFSRFEVSWKKCKW